MSCDYRAEVKVIFLQERWTLIVQDTAGFFITLERTGTYEFNLQMEVVYHFLNWAGDSVTRFGDLLDFEPLFKAFGNN